MMIDRNSWRRVRLGEITRLNYGKNLTENMRRNGNVPVYGSAGIIGWHDIPLTQSSTLVIGRKGSVGNVFLSDVPCYPIDTTYYIQQSTCSFDLKWLYICLVKLDLRRFNMATAIPGLNREILHELEIIVPSVVDQKQIVELFQSVDYAVEQVEVQQARVGELKKSFLFDLFSKKKLFSEIILQDDYESIRFGSLASNISERVEPKKTDMSIYVGLEHLETDNLVIERTGSPNDVVGTKLKVSKGDIIFGKRRAYLRKVAVSHFDGIASAHSMVLRPNEQKINRDFLPYFMQSDEFMNRAIQISEGSLSPTIKWKTLAAQEFVLLRKDKQPKLVELFKQLDETRDLLRNQKNNLIKLKQQLLLEILG